MPTYTNPKSDRRSLTQVGNEVGADNVVLTENVADREDAVLTWECPRKYSAITYAAGRHTTQFTPRYKESQDGDGATTTFSLEGNIAAPAGETNLAEMQYQPVVAYDDVAGAQLEVESYNFNTNTVTFVSAPDTGVENVHLFPVITEGYIKFVGHDQFDHRIAALDEWGIPLHVFNDFNSHQNMTKIHLTGAVSFEESEKLALYIKSPRVICWEDDDFPEGRFVSVIEQRVDVDV